MKNVIAVLTLAVMVTSVLFTNALNSYIVLSIASMFGAAFITQLGFAQVFGTLFIVKLATMVHTPVKKDTTTEEAIASFFNIVVYTTLNALVIWAIAYIAYTIFL